MSEEDGVGGVEPDEVALLPASSLGGAGTALLRQHTFGLLSAVMDGEEEEEQEGGLSPVPSQSGHSLAGPGSVARPPPPSASRLFSRKHSLAEPSALLRSSSAIGNMSPASPRNLGRHSSTLTLGPDADSAVISESVFDDHGSPKPFARPSTTHEEDESAGSGESADEAKCLPHRARVRQAHVTLSTDEATSSKRLKSAVGEGDDVKDRDENEEHDAFAEGADEALHGEDAADHGSGVGDADDDRCAGADDDGLASKPDSVSRRQSWMDNTGGSSWRVF